MMLNFQLNNSIPSPISYQTNLREMLYLVTKHVRSHKDNISFLEQSGKLKWGFVVYIILVP